MLRGPGWEELSESVGSLVCSTIMDLVYCRELTATVTASRDSTVKVWELNWQIRMVFLGHTGALCHPGFSLPQPTSTPHHNPACAPDGTTPLACMQAQLQRWLSFRTHPYWYQPRRMGRFGRGICRKRCRWARWR